MKRVLFIMTHPEVELKEVIDTLERHPNISCFSTGNSYRHPDDLENLTSLIHKRDNSAAIWADVILDNKDFTCRALIGHCKFLYWVDRPTQYRLVGLQQWYRRTGGIWTPPLDELLTLVSEEFSS